MLSLKYPFPELQTYPGLDDEDTPNAPFCLFDCPLQGVPALQKTHARSLGRMMTEIRRRLTTVTGMVCHPHRVGIRNYVSVTLSNDSQKEVNLLLLISGEVEFPQDYEPPRWTVQVTDGVDLLFLLLWLKEAVK